MYRLASKKRTGFTLLEIMIVVLILALLLAIAVPNWLEAREVSRSKACQDNLKQIDNAIQQWMMDNKITSYSTVQTQTADGDNTFASTPGGAPATAQPLVPTYIRSEPACPEGGLYSTGDGSTTTVSCSLAATTPASFGSGGTYPHTLGGT